MSSPRASRRMRRFAPTNPVAPVKSVRTWNLPCGPLRAVGLLWLGRLLCRDSRRVVEHAFDDERRTPLHFLIDVAQVRTQNAEAEQLDTAHKQYQDNHGGQSGRDELRRDESNTDFHDGSEKR